MKNKMRIVTALILAGSMLVSMTACTGKTAAKKTAVKAEEENGPYHFTAFFATEGEETSADNTMRKVITDKVGADCDVEYLGGQDQDKIMKGYIDSDSYPDFITGNQKLYEAGALLPLDSYIEKNTYLKNYLTGDQWESLRQPDGHIYWIPQFGVAKWPQKTMIHKDEAFWIQTRVLKWADYPEINTLEEYFNLLEAYQEANPTMQNGTPNIPFSILCDDWRYYCLENPPMFLDGHPNEGCAIVDPQTGTVSDYNTTPTAQAYFRKLNEEYHKGIIDPTSFTSGYDEYLKKLSTGAVLGMVDQYWNFYYQIWQTFEEEGLVEEGCDYVPLPITMDGSVRNQWHTESASAFTVDSGIAISKSCKKPKEAAKFMNDLLNPEVQKLRFWGIQNQDYSVGKDGTFFLTQEQREKHGSAANYYCQYEYFPRVEGYLDDGKNAFSPEYQPGEFFSSLPVDVQTTLTAYGCKSYVDMLGDNPSPGPWYPLYSYSDTLSDSSKAGVAKTQITEVKHTYLPRVILADNFDEEWQQYMDAYQSCDPQAYFDVLQERVNEVRNHESEQ